MTNASIPFPSNVYTVENEDGDVLLSWDKVDANYYIVYESYNEIDWYPLVDRNEKNMWYWDTPYCIRIYGHDPGSMVYYAVAAVKDDIMSEYSYSEGLLLSSKLSDKEFDQYLNQYVKYINVDGLRMNFESHFVYQSDEDNLTYVYSYLDEIDYFNYIEFTKISDYKLAKALKDKAVEYSKLVGQDVVITLVYSDAFYTNPVSFRNNYIYSDTITYYQNDRYWFVWYPLLEVDNFSNFYNNWHGSFYF